MLRQKNNSVRGGRIAEADTLASRIGKAIMEQNVGTFKGERGIANSADLWDKVQTITGKNKGKIVFEGFDAAGLNQYYAAISTDNNYIPPSKKSSCLPAADSRFSITPLSVLFALEALKPTSPGSDGIPHWLLKNAAPIIAEPLAALFNASLSNALVPRQWKTALITPVPKVPTPKSNADFRPISLTPILSRVLEKCLVRRVFYPLLQQPTESMLVDDQYAFQPTASTTAALIAMLHHITEMVSKYGVVQIIALDFSQAFDTVRHCTYPHG